MSIDFCFTTDCKTNLFFFYLFWASWTLPHYLSHCGWCSTASMKARWSLLFNSTKWHVEVLHYQAKWSKKVCSLTSPMSKCTNCPIIFFQVKSLSISWECGQHSLVVNITTVMRAVHAGGEPSRTRYTSFPKIGGVQYYFVYMITELLTFQIALHYVWQILLLLPGKNQQHAVVYCRIMVNHLFVSYCDMLWSKLREYTVKLTTVDTIR